MPTPRRPGQRPVKIRRRLGADCRTAIGSGAVTISGGLLAANTAQSPASVILTSGQLDFGDSPALSSPLTIAGGSLDNSSGSPMMLAGGSVQTWNGNFTFVGSNPLDLSSQYVLRWRQTSW